MYGAILGDIIGQPYEFNGKGKTKDFPLFCPHPTFTDDTVMTIAVCDGILKAGLDADEVTMKTSIITSMQLWGHKYPHAGYGGKFYRWLAMESTKPYNSYGNGSAMRVSSVGWFYESLERTREVARWSAEVTHNHPEGIKGAEATASAIWMARNGKFKAQIKEYIRKEFKYDLNRTCAQIRPKYYHQESCQKSVPESIIAFIEGTSYEDVVRNAVSLGGDSDTQACIAGAMAQAFYGLPETLTEKCRTLVSPEMQEVLDAFEKKALAPNPIMA